MSKMMKKAGLAAGLVAIAAGAHIGASEWGASRIRDRVMTTTALHGVVAGIESVSFNPVTGKAVVAGLSLKRGDVTARVGKVTHRSAPLGGIIAPAMAADSSYTMEDVDISTENSSITAEELVVEEASLDEDGLQDLFDADAFKDVLDGLKSLSFKSVKSPEIVLTQKFGPQESKVAYKNVSFDNMKNGKVARVTSQTAEGETKTPEGVQTMRIGLQEMVGADLVVMARYWGDKPNPGDALVTATESSRIESMTVSMAGKFDMSVAKVEMGATRLKPMATPFSTFISTFGGKKSGEKTTPAENKLLVGFLRDLFSSISDDGIEARDIKFTVRGGEPAEFRIDKIGGSFGGGKVPSGYRIEGVFVNAPVPGGAAKVKLGQFSVEGFSFGGTLEAIAKAIEAGDPDMKKVDPRTLIPQLGTITLRGLEVDAPDPKAPKGAPAERISFKLGNFTIGARSQIKGVPTDINLALDNLAVKLPENSPDETIKQMKAFGYSAVDLSAKIAAKWNESAKEIALTEVSVGGEKMGSAKITGAIGNIGRDLFEADAAMMQIALLGATAKSLSLKLENTGLAENLLAMQARSTGRSADEIRAELGSMAALGIPAILGPSDDAKAIANAVAKFLGKPKSLTLDVTAKNAGGIGIPDIATVSDPQKALTLVNVKASAD